MSEQVTSLSTFLQVAPGFADVEAAILRAVVYADIFDYPLKAREIGRHLIGVQAGQGDVEAALVSVSANMSLVRFTNGYFTLDGREGLVQLRQQREAAAERRWLAARRYGKWIAAMPFVRMVAVTGALAVNNEDGPDLDYLVVTEEGRLWLCRGLVMLLVRWAKRHGDEICPNYFLAESALRLVEQNLYTAHEMAQMVPLSGLEVYWRMRELNPWVGAFLPNATGLPPQTTAATEPGGSLLAVRQAAEKLLRTPPGERVENWEMSRKVRKLRAQVTGRSEADFCGAWCKGHFGGYGRKTQEAYQSRLQILGIDNGLWELR